MIRVEAKIVVERRCASVRSWSDEAFEIDRNKSATKLSPSTTNHLHLRPINLIAEIWKGR